jgi:hypothetical protein
VMLSSDRVIFRRLARTKKPSAEYCTRLSSETDDLRSALKSLTRATDFTPIQAKRLLRFDGGHLCLDATYVLEERVEHSFGCFETCTRAKM